MELGVTTTETFACVEGGFHIGPLGLLGWLGAGLVGNPELAPGLVGAGPQLGPMLVDGGPALEPGVHG